MDESLYRCSIAALYQSTILICGSAKSRIADFQNYKQKYDIPFFDAILAKVAAAKLLPDYQARQEQSELDYLHLCEQLNTNTTLWQNLKSYIRDAFPESEQKIRLEAAGASHYTAASSKDWEAASALLLAANNFINDNDIALEANQNMPVSFKGNFAAQYTAFSSKLTAYQDAAEQIKIDTRAKIQANNSIYKDITNVCADGQQIFKTDSTLKDQFVWDTVLKLTTGTGSTGLRGTVTNVITSQPVTTGGSITTNPPTKVATIQSDGTYELLIPAQTLTLIVNCPTYQPTTVENVQVDTGIIHTQNISLTPNP
ncbi:MAG: hypothetical protein NTX03_00400 [Bacteroidetes bacterium]|nr:hypothetical protein [Bacteroidota bacterium]